MRRIPKNEDMSELKPDLSNQKRAYTTGGSRCGGIRQGGGAEWSRAGRDADGSVRRGENRLSCPLEPPEHRLQIILNDSLEA